jgi:hypothetical protein
MNATLCELELWSATSGCDRPAVRLVTINDEASGEDTFALCSDHADELVRDIHGGLKRGTELVAVVALDVNYLHTAGGGR